MHPSKIPLKCRVQISFKSIVVHDAPYFETGPGTIRLLGTWVELATNSLKYHFFNFAETEAQNTPFFRDFGVLDDGKNVPLFCKI